MLFLSCHKGLGLNTKKKAWFGFEKQCFDLNYLIVYATNTAVDVLRSIAKNSPFLDVFILKYPCAKVTETIQIATTDLTT